MSPQINPVLKRNPCELDQIPVKFAAASAMRGKDRRTNVLAFGIAGRENPFINGKNTVPKKNPPYIPKHRAHTAVGFPKT